MNSSLLKRLTSRNWELPEWIWEVLIFVTVTPAIVHGLTSLSGPALA